MSSSTDPAPDEVYCRHCGETIAAAAEICPECGVRQRPPPTSSAVEHVLEGRNPFVAALLSLALPGLGQVYNRDIGLGIFFFVSFVFAVLSLVFLVGIVLVPAIWLYSIYDAFVTAQRRREEYEASQVDAP